MTRGKLNKVLQDSPNREAVKEIVKTARTLKKQLKLYRGINGSPEENFAIQTVIKELERVFTETKGDLR